MFAENEAPAPRLPLQFDIEYRRSYGRQTEMGILRNISITGAFLQHENHQFKAQDKLSIFFKVSGRIRKVSATVVWSNDRGVGVKFNPFNNQDVQIVDDLMYFVKDSRDSHRSVLDDIFKRVA